MKKPGTEIIVFSILAIAFIFVSIFFWITYSNEKITERESKDVSTSLAILRNVENIFTDAQHLEIGYTTFIITGKESSLEPFNTVLQKSTQDMAGLQDASSKDSVRKADAKQLCNLFTEQILFGKNVVQTRRTKGMNAAIRMAIGENGKQLPDEIHRLTGKIEERERPVLRSENASQPERAGKTMLHFIILTIVFSIFLVAGFIFIGKDLAKNKLLGNQLIQLNRNLSEQVRIKTLEATEVFNRVSDAIIALDHHWCYTYINKKAGLFSNKPVEELIGKNIWVVFPEIVNHEFHKACIQAMESQQYISIEDYYSKQDKWFLNHIYPSSRGLTIYFNDITERKKEDDLLKKNEEKFRALIEHSNDAISIVNEKGEIVYRSPAAEKITGFTLEEVAGKKSIDFVHPDDRENVLEFYRDMEKEPGCSRKKEHRLLHKDGHYVWSEGTITNLLHQDQIRGFVSNFHDITDRKNSERALIESEIRLREIINNEPECVKLLNEKGELLKMNPAGLAIIEADTFEQVKGMSVYSLVDEPYRNDFAEMTGDIFNGQSRQMEFSITGLKGKKRFMETHAVPLKNADGNIIALLAVTRDVTEKKKIEQELLLSEQQYRSFFEQASDAIFVTDFNGVIKDMNLSLCNMFGYSREELLNMNVTDIIDKDQLERQPIVFEKLLAGQHVFSNRKMVRRNGTVIDVEANVKKMSDNRILVIARDVTERNKTQDELSKTSHQLKNIFESLEHSFWGINIEKHEMLYVSPGAKKIYGYPESSFMNNPDFWMEVILPEDRHLVNSIYPFINEGKPAVVHYRIRRADGIPRWLELRITPTLGADGKLVQLDGITIDITDEKKAEQELKISSSLLKATLESTNDGILVVGRNGKITGYNSQFMKMWNISEEVIQKTDDEIAMRQGLKQLKDPESFSRRVKELYESPDEVSFDTFELIDGRTFERYSQPQRMNNEIVGRVWSFRDVTKQKKAEEETKKVANQLTELSASIPGIVYQFKLSADGSMSYPFVSEGVYELSGLTPKEIYENSHVTFSIVHEDDVASLFQSIQTSAQTLQPWFHIFRINDREGNCKWIRGNSIPHQLPDGDIIWNGTMIDITELKTTEEELKSSELRFRSLFEQASDGIFISDPNGNLIDANSIGCQMLGYTREEIMELNLSEIILVLDKEPPLQIDRVNGGENVLMTRTVRRKNGSLFPVEINSKMLADGRILGIVRDITERKKTEEAITEREARYRSVVENIHEALVMDDKDGNLVYVNNEFSNIFGYSKEELKNLNLKDYTSPASYTEVLERHQQRIQGKQVPSEFLYKGMRKDGTERWIEARVSCIVKNGEIIGTQSLERDVTERKHAEEELIKSEQSFIGLFNSSSEAIYIQDANGAFLNVNDGAVKMYGYSREEFIGRTPDFLSAPGRNNMNQVLEILNNVFFTGGSEQFDFWGRRKNGEIFPKEVIVQRGNYFGKTVIITTARDITERKKAEEALVEKENRLQTILNSEPECVKLTGPDGVVTEMNPAGLEMIEADHLDEVKGKSVFSLINEPFRKPYIQLTEDVFHGKPGTLEFEFTTLKGNRRWMEMHAVPLKDAEGKIISLLSISRDSTERRKTENALIQSELRYRTLIEHASDGIFIFDDEGNFSDVNSSASHLTGYSHDELLNMDIKDIVFEEDLETNPVRMQELKAGETVVRERRLRRKDGTALAVEINSKKLPDGRYVGMARDIQERKKIENKLVENETRLKEAQRLALIGSWDSDLINDHIKWSDEVYRIFGLEPQEFKATYQAFLEHVHPDDRSFLNESYNKSIKEKSRFDIVHRIVMKDQSIKYVNEKCETFYDETGKAIRSIGTVQDITERKKAEDEIKLSQERFRTLYEENPLMNFTLDKKGNILSVNKRGAKELEYTPDELIGKPVFRIFHAEDHEKVLLQIQKCISTPRQSFSWEMSQLTRSGCTIWVSETGTALPDEHGNYLVMVVCENVTERKKTEEELHQMNEQLRYLSSHLQSIREEERANIAREIHDELGQQLTGLKMDASWLNKKIPAEDKISHDKIKDMISLLDETVKTVRRISTELRPSILDDLGLVDALDWQSSEFEKRTGIHCRFKSTSAEMQLDKNLSTGIFRVYQETLTNIARHAEATEIKTFFELSDQHAILMIRDNGKGFDEAEIKNKHTLGLTGMKERAIMFGGKLTIESSKGKGTAILLRVPLKISPGNIIL